jgi:hypothetical protein
MIIAPDVFEIESGAYTPTLHTPWIAHHGVASTLYVGRTLRYTKASGWEVGPASITAKTTWKSIDKSAKAIKEAFDTAEVPKDPAEDYYELIGPGLAGNPHGKDEGQFALIRAGELTLVPQPPRTSLYALADWLDHNGVPGLLWRWNEEGTDEPHLAAVRRELLP